MPTNVQKRMLLKLFIDFVGFFLYLASFLLLHCSTPISKAPEVRMPA